MGWAFNAPPSQGQPGLGPPTAPPPALPPAPPPFGGPPPDLPAQGEKRRRWTAGLVVGLLGVLVVVATVLFVMSRLPDLNSWPRASGEQSPVELTAGTWTVYAENGGRAPLAIEGPDGQAIPLQSRFGTETFQIGDRSGESVGEIDAPVDGVYRVTTNPGDTVAFGQRIVGDFLIATVAVIGGGLLALVLIITGVVLVAVRR